ncbi:YitT family protein [Lactobacillus sp. PFC-70]|uniref:YitT family protein n=2 Tax=Levilactobacillus namurensis TaxID=380393 RepID=A0AAW8W736_9LACO|nr:YitT family protein [Levilactobacillus namurensis]PTM23899.1 YitT family protein [Lactobacillus sp. PFC-70]MCW3777527.1 YitT family protein [Levilactobacillus namurensis]MDT7014345.1 YitT family protein [Levilactobacillus namurensis]MDT7018727.1 YitT family protein [Levilactobacillus namurensis]WNN66650.1 YitT family protein [Levilactobacillus namurensis]
MALEKDQMGRQILVLIGSAVISAIALNEFLIPGKIFSAGINGISQILAMLLQMVGLHVNTGWFILLFNVPIGLLGWFKVGRGFTFYSILVAIFTSILTIVIPVEFVAHNTLLAALFGGILTGIGVAYPLKYGFSTGGMDIVAVVLEKTTGRTIGTLMLMINLGIVLIAGGLFGWESALYTIISIYAMSRVVDSIHTRHQKLTAFIVTQQQDAVIEALSSTLIRGITIMPAVGAYRRQDSAVLMVVISRYELYALEHAVKETDPHAFVNLVNTIDIEGNFYNETEQLKIRQTERPQQ